MYRSANMETSKPPSPSDTYNAMERVNGTLTCGMGAVVESGLRDLGAAGAFSGKVESGFPSENATNAKMPERFLSPIYVKPL
jgi:hypothetical protein